MVKFEIKVFTKLYKKFAVVKKVAIRKDTRHDNHIKNHSGTFS